MSASSTAEVPVRKERICVVSFVVRSGCAAAQTACMRMHSLIALINGPFSVKRFSISQAFLHKSAPCMVRKSLVQAWLCLECLFEPRLQPLPGSRIASTDAEQRSKLKQELLQL